MQTTTLWRSCMVDKRLRGQRSLQRSKRRGVKKQQRQSRRGNWRSSSLTEPSANQRQTLYTDGERHWKDVQLSVAFLNKKSQVLTFIIKRVCFLAHSRRKKQMQRPFLKKCCEKPLMQNIKASQSPPPHWTPSIIMHLEPERCRKYHLLPCKLLFFTHL